MDNNKRDTIILEKIIDYCKIADETITRFGDSIGILKKDNIYKNALSMCVLQIGELSNTLSAEFITKHKEIPWKSIISMRNRAAHGYEYFDSDILWQTVKTDLPTLKKYCKEVLISRNIIID